jgi:leader peptidase (prepilin peptidase)/N-methyltransferase
LLLVLVLAGVDFLYLKIPNLMIYPALAFNMIAIALIDFTFLNDAAIGTTAVLAIMFVVALVGGPSLGMGDVKFGSFLGGALGWKLGLFAGAIGLALGAVAALVLLYLGFRSRKDAVPLAPFLAAGALVTTLLGGTLLGGIFVG